MQALKINCKKSNSIVLDVDMEQEYMVANIFGCEVDSLGLTYLGVPTSCKKLIASNFDIMVPKVSKKIGNSKCWHWSGKC
jgi:hypothetical protein